MHELIKALYEKFPLKMTDIAKASNVTRPRVQQLVDKIQDENLAVKIGPEWRFKHEALDWMKNREGRRV